jgi:hypothetical protein
MIGMDFNEVKKQSRRLEELMKEKFPDAFYTIIPTLWMDGDFQIECRSAAPLVEGSPLILIRRFLYHHSEGETYYSEYIPVQQEINFDIAEMAKIVEVYNQKHNTVTDE